MKVDALQVIPSLTSAMSDTQLSDKQPFLWVEGAGNLNLTSLSDRLENSSDFGNLSSQLFIASLPVGSDTGLLSALVLRFNSSVSCELVPPSDFPVSCQGNNPFNKSYTNINKSTPFPFGDHRDPKFQARLCAPGDILTSPWHEISDRQDITEDFYLDFQSTDLTPRITNYTLHCATQTSLGYSELPSYWNGHLAGPLLSVIPPESGPNQTFNDMGYPHKYNGPAYNPSQEVPGPFLSSILGIFGNDTFFDTVASHSNYDDSGGLLCQQLRQPFIGLAIGKQEEQSLWESALFNARGTTTPVCQKWGNQTSNSSLLLDALLDWLPNFGNVETAEAAFTLTTYSANTAILKNSQDFEIADGSIIITTPGYSVEKPSIPLPAVVLISILLLFQLIGLAWLSILGSGRSTWTSSMNAFALLRMGAALHKEMPLISVMKAAELEILDEKPGWVGGDGREQGTEKLVMGGSEEVKSDTKYRMVENEQEWAMDEWEIGGLKGCLCGGGADKNLNPRGYLYRNLQASAGEDDVDHC